MAKAQTYTDDLLLSAVIKYAERFSGKIIISDLAKWASANIPGLEGVQYYHFTRSVKIKDPKTGKTIEKKKQCTERIEELNKARSVSCGIKKNVLLQSARIDDFLKLPVQTQRKVILDTREQMDSLVQQNIYLTRTNKQLQEENEKLKEVNWENDEKWNELSARHKLLIKQVEGLIAVYGEDSMWEALRQIGVTDEGFDLKAYTESLSLDNIKDNFSIKEALKQTKNHITDDIMKGLEF